MNEKLMQKFFAVNASVLTIVQDKNESVNVLNNNISSISTRAYEWKVFQAQKAVYFQEKNSFKIIRQ